MKNVRDRISASVEAFYPTDQQRIVADCAADILGAGLGVEIWLLEHGLKQRTQEAAGRLRDLCRAAEIVTVHTSVFSCSLDALRAEVAMAASLCAKTLVVHPPTLGLVDCENPPSVQELRDICKLALDSGFCIALENNPQTGIHLLEQALDMIGSEPARSGLGICIDTGHANMTCREDGAGPATFLDRFAHVILELHINDNDGTKDSHLPPGDGTADWPELFASMRRLRDDTVVCLEFSAPEDTIARLMRAREFVCNGCA